MIGIYRKLTDKVDRVISNKILASCDFIEKCSYPTTELGVSDFNYLLGHTGVSFVEDNIKLLVNDKVVGNSKVNLKGRFFEISDYLVSLDSLSDIFGEDVKVFIYMN